MLSHKSTSMLLSLIGAVLASERKHLAAAHAAYVYHSSQTVRPKPLIVTTRPRQASSCFPADPNNTIADRLNAALSAQGATGLSIQLCPDTTYPITSPIKFAFPNQEITTQGFPGLDLSHRANVVVSGSTANDGTGHTMAFDGSCNTCMSVALRYVQIDGNRGSGPLQGGANIEFV